MYSSFIICFLNTTLTAQTIIAAKDAGKHVGETVSITSTVLGGRLLAPSNTIVLDLVDNNLRQELILVIPASDKGKFKGEPQIDYKGRQVTVTGKIVLDKGKPEIIVKEPKQLKMIFLDNVKGQRI